MKGRSGTEQRKFGNNLGDTVENRDNVQKDQNKIETLNIEVDGEEDM
jgi:hypothetical protein